MPPIKKWEVGFFGANGRPLPMKISDERKLRLAFMPFTERTVQPAGVEFEGFHYFADALRTWVRFKSPGSTRARKFVFTFDPRDISRLFFFDPDARDYFEVPFRNTSCGPVSIWEARAARARLVAEGKSDYDEAMIFEKIADMRQEMEKRAAKSKKLRREKQRLVHQARSRSYITAPSIAAQLAAEAEPTEEALESPIEPFAVEKI
jgi:putative transposase